MSKHITGAMIVAAAALVLLGAGCGKPSPSDQAAAPSERGGPTDPLDDGLDAAIEDLRIIDGE